MYCWRSEQLVHNPYTDYQPRPLYSSLNEDKMISTTGLFTMGDSPTRALWSGVSVAGIEALMIGSGGVGRLPVIGIVVPLPIKLAVDEAVASYGADIALSVLDKFGLGAQAWARLAVSLGVSGAVFTYMSQPNPGVYWEEFAIGAVSYVIGDKVNSYVYSSPGKIMPTGM